MATSNAGVSRRRNVDGVVSSIVWLVFIAVSLSGCEERGVQPASSLAALSGEQAGSAAADGGALTGDAMRDDAIDHEAMIHDAMAHDAAAHDATASHELDAMLDEPDAMVHEPDAMTHEPDAMTHEPDAMAHEPDAMAHEPDASPPSPDAAMHHGDMDDDAGAEPDATEPDLADEHCAMAIDPDPRDALIESSAPVVWQANRARDVLLPQVVIDWMDEQQLQEAHNAWHTTRRWDDICGESFAHAENCDFALSLVDDGLWRAEYQQGAPGAGAAFLHMHRHMIRMFKAAFPNHADLFAGWTHVPRSRLDPANPTPWRTITWTDDNLAGFDILENIEDHLDAFPNDDELGVYVESTFRWTPETPFVGNDAVGSGVHGALHGQWAISRSPANLGRTDTALPNYVFWKLHGFIDDVWSRYRAAKGLSDADPEYRAVAHEECRLMYYLAPAHRPDPPPPTDALLKRR